MFVSKGCGAGAGGGQKCPKTGAVGSKAQCPGSKSGCGNNSGKPTKWSNQISLSIQTFCGYLIFC